MSIRPDYYTQNGLEAFDVIKAFFMDKAFLSHAFKYMARAGRKGDEREDIRKAITYLEEHLKTLEPEPESFTVTLTENDPVALSKLFGKPTQGITVVDYTDAPYVSDPVEDEAWEDYFNGRKFRRLDDENAYEEETAYLTGGK